jgi:hypothetical protein
MLRAMSSTGNKRRIGSPKQTWNTPEAIAKHRAMTPEQRIKKTVEVSQQAMKMARARRVDDA